MSNNLDYSPHIIKTHQGLKAMRVALLNNDFDKSLEVGKEALVELRMALIAIQDMKEKHYTER